MVVNHNLSKLPARSMLSRDDQQMDTSLISISSFPDTPSTTDCLSSAGESDHDISLLSKPVTRDPALLFDRLEESQKRLGRNKRRRLEFERDLANRVKDIEIDPRDLLKPYRSSFTKLFESPTNMMIWNHFANLSEEDQADFISKPRVGKSRRKLANIEEEEDHRVADGRALHPAAIELCSCCQSSNDKFVIDTELQLNFVEDHFQSRKKDDDSNCCFEINKRLIKDCCWTINVLQNEFSKEELLMGNRKLFLIDGKFSVSKMFGQKYISTEEIRRFGNSHDKFFIEMGNMKTISSFLVFKTASEDALNCIFSAFYRTFLEKTGYAPNALIKTETRTLFQPVRKVDKCLITLEDCEVPTSADESDSVCNSSFESLSDCEL